MADRRTSGAATARGVSAPVRTVAVLVPILLALGAAELIVRVTGLASPNHRMIYADTVVKGRPNARYVSRKENRNVVLLNNVGFHDRDWDVTDDECGLLFLGDSMVEGIQVPVDSLFTSVLEDRFASEGVSVDVLNAAVSATGTGHQYLLWNTFVRDSGTRVDHVALCLFPQNDLKNNHVSIGKGAENYGVYLGPDGTPYVHKSGSSRARSALRRLTVYSALLNLIYTRLHYLGSGDGPAEEEPTGAAPTAEVAPEEEPTGAAPTAEVAVEDAVSEAGAASGGSRASHPDFTAPGSEELWADSLERTLLLIERWKREVTDMGVTFSVVIIPNTDRNNFYEDELSRRLEEAGRAGSLRVLRLELEGRDQLETNSFDGETLGHLNCMGHRVAARELHRWFEEGGLGRRHGEESLEGRSDDAVETASGGEGT